MGEVKGLGYVMGRGDVEVGRGGLMVVVSLGGLCRNDGAAVIRSCLLLLCRAGFGVPQPLSGKLSLDPCTYRPDNDISDARTDWG